MSWESLYPWTWYFWIALFIIFEFVPVAFRMPQYTLSEYIWRLEQVNASWTAVRYFIAAGCLWLFFHLVFGVFP